jgi:glutaredoxin 3
MKSFFVVLGLVIPATAFVSPHPANLRTAGGGRLRDSSVDEMIENIKEDFQAKYRIVQESQQAGASFKQIIANLLAGDYDQAQVKTRIEELLKSAPCVMFTWQNSPSCKSAVKAMGASGFDYTVVRLDDPWDEGNKIRAEIGKMVGRTSVPMVFIGGKYVGGFDGGINDDAPGLVALAFRGCLQSMLKGAGSSKAI